MSKAGSGLVAPMGFKFDEDLSLIDNAQAAWTAELDRRRLQAEHHAKVLARRVFRTDAIDFIYEQWAPETPTFEIGDERIAKTQDGFALVEFCGDCGRHWRFYDFGSLAGLGRAIALRNDEPEAFTCRECKITAALAGKK